MEIKKVDLKIKSPEKSCGDVNCPFHGHLKCRGRTFVGTVISGMMQKTVIIEFERIHYLKKYERYEKRRSKVNAHNPLCINAKEGDIIKIMECRPLSKTKNFVVVEIIGKEKGFKERMEAKEESKVKKEIVQKKDADEEKKAEEVMI